MTAETYLEFILGSLWLQEYFFRMIKSQAAKSFLGSDGHCDCTIYPLPYALHMLKLIKHMTIPRDFVLL